MVSGCTNHSKPPHISIFPFKSWPVVQTYPHLTDAHRVMHITGDNQYDQKYSRLLKHQLHSIVVRAEETTLRNIPGGGLQRHSGETLEWKEWVDVDICGIEEVIPYDGNGDDDSDGEESWWYTYENAIVGIKSYAECGSAWRPPVGEGTKVHRIVGMLCMLDPDDKCRFEVQKDTIVHSVFQELQALRPRQVNEEESKEQQHEENDDDEEEMKHRIPFTTDALLDPPRAGPIPCRVRYRFTYPEEFYEQAVNYAAMADQCRERIADYIYDHEISDTKLYIFRHDTH